MQGPDGGPLYLSYLSLSYLVALDNCRVYVRLKIGLGVAVIA